MISSCRRICFIHVGFGVVWNWGRYVSCTCKVSLNCPFTRALLVVKTWNFAAVWAKTYKGRNPWPKYPSHQSLEFRDPPELVLRLCEIKDLINPLLLSASFTCTGGSSKRETSSSGTEIGGQDVTALRTMPINLDDRFLGLTPHCRRRPRHSTNSDIDNK